ncbi:MAG TPA: double-strand break repair helicase AddA [Alphaproteobacteria bacterium]|nr:double-strand break repair helicase AddA [Alphaproteobacteria bacterium]
MSGGRTAEAAGAAAEASVEGQIALPAQGGFDFPLDPGVVQRRASDPHSSVWVAASAGTGKTKVLTDRVLRLMLAGTKPNRILCLTFTRAAAAEMANRINETLSTWATVDDGALVERLTALSGRRPTADELRAARRLFALVLDSPGGMTIQTIHAFCQSLLRRFPLEAGIGPHFEVLDERTAGELMIEARDRLVNAARQAPEGAVAAALARLTAALDEERFGALMQHLAAERSRLDRLFTDQGGPEGGVEGAIAALYARLDVPEGWDGERVLRQACADHVFDAPGLREACDALTRGSPTDTRRGEQVARWLAAAIEERVERFAEYRTNFFTQKGEILKTLATKKAAAAETALRQEAERLLLVLERWRAAETAACTAAALTIGHALLATYSEQKRNRGLLDFDDLIVATNALLQKPGIAPWVLYKLDGGLDHILIDEAQDTNPDQWQVVKALTEEFFATPAATRSPRTVFVVGDEKQSIYSFQRADPEAFRQVRALLEDRVSAAGLRWDRVPLEISFRSTASVLGLVDAVFAREPARHGVVFEAGATVRHRPHRRGQAGLVELWPAVVPAERPEREPWAPPRAEARERPPEARLAGAIAATVADWLRRGEALESRGRPIRPGDVLVLVRRRSGFVEHLVKAFKDRGVPVAGVDRLVLTDQLGVMDLIAVAKFLLLPEDCLNLAIVLRSPFIGLSEDALYALAQPRRGRLWPALRAAAEGDPELAAARDWLERWLNLLGTVPPYELLAAILESPCPAGASGRQALLRRLGPEAGDPVDEFLALALNFETTHAGSLELFVRWVCTGEAEVKRELDPMAGEVRIMTVHGSKGLQAPIVFLPDTLQVPDDRGQRFLWPQDGGVPLWVPRRELEEGQARAARMAAELKRDQEYRRLLYVALTRAEDRLYVCGWQTRKAPPPFAWYDLVRQAIEPEGAPFDFDMAPLIGADGWQGQAWRLSNAQTATPKTDPWMMEAAAAAPLPDWAGAPIPEEPKPPLRLVPSAPSEPEPALFSPARDRDRGRLAKGVLIHKLLQVLPGLAPAARRPYAEDRAARPVDGYAFEAAEQAEIVAEVLAVLDSPELAPLFGPGSRAEVPIVGRIGEYAMSGQIDRLLVTPERIRLLDYKTMRPSPTRLEDVPAPYLKQLAAYRAGLRAIYPGRPVEASLLWTDGPRLMTVPDEVLERWAL